MNELYHDAMAIRFHFWNPDFFITFTANPNWPEIIRELFPGQQPTDRPDLLARVFRLKLKELLDDLKSGVLGPYEGHVYTIEYQKRGLPHAHILLFIRSVHHFKNAAAVDEVICAELPNPLWDPTGDLRDLILEKMVHGPCGDYNPKAACMESKTPNGPRHCAKRYPKPFTDVTVVTDDTYPKYRRRHNGITWEIRKPGSVNERVVLDNRWVVPYNPYLLQKYRCHINIEIASSVAAVKYIFKYVFKGPDRITLAVEKRNLGDEVTQYIHGRYIGPTEAFWRVFEYPTHGRYPSVQRLQVHLKDQHQIQFPLDATPSQIALLMEEKRTTLMGLFEYNRSYSSGRHLTYPQFPTKFVWKKETREWTPRQKLKAYGRMYTCSPLAGERYYLRLLLTTVCGPQSFEDLYEFDGVTYPTYYAACVARNLCRDDKEWFHFFNEAKVYTSGYGLRSIFISGL